MPIIIISYVKTIKYVCNKIINYTEHLHFEYYYKVQATSCKFLTNSSLN